MVNIRKNLTWALKHRHWRSEDWEKELWTEEASCTIFGGKTRPAVRIKGNKFPYPYCVQKPFKHGGGNVIAWGCFSAGETGALIEVKGKIDKQVYKNILTRHAKPTLVSHNLSHFQQDERPETHSKSRKTVLEWKMMGI